MRWTIRWRLTLWNTLALGVLLLAFSGLVYGLLVRTLYAAIDRTLEDSWRQMADDNRVVTDPVPERRCRHGANPAFAQRWRSRHRRTPPPRRR